MRIYIINMNQHSELPVTHLLDSMMFTFPPFIHYFILRVSVDYVQTSDPCFPSLSLSLSHSSFCILLEARYHQASVAPLLSLRVNPFYILMSMICAERRKTGRSPGDSVPQPAVGLFIRIEPKNDAGTRRGRSDLEATRVVIQPFVNASWPSGKPLKK